MKIIMGLNAPWIGGTRIYVMSLAEALIKRGHSLILLTDPGVLEDELVCRGIPYVTRSETDSEMVRLLLDLVKSERPDLIHSHPAAFIQESYVVSLLTGVPFVVTMHGEYLMQFDRNYLGWQIGTSVGQVIAVSEQIKEFLLRSSTLVDGKITVIPNGIDFVKYSPSPDCVELRRSLGINPEETVIMYLGRLDADKAKAISAAVSVVELLCEEGESVKGVFVGKGDQESFLKDRKNLILTGFRRDIPELLAIADVVIATGRSALEALAVAKPVIAVGRAGMHGLVTQDNWEQGVSTNFGDHGYLQHPEPNLLFSQVRHGLKMTETERMNIRQLTKGHYDIAKVVKELETVYAQVLKATR